MMLAEKLLIVGLPPSFAPPVPVAALSAAPAAAVAAIPASALLL